MASIVQTRGSLYFLRDKDYLTGEVGKYVKIGLVRYDKPTKDRVKEHQTGNPRGILDVCTIEDVPFVEQLENIMHYKYNHAWVTGEWFLLSNQELKQVIQDAEALKQEQKKHHTTVLRAEELSKFISNGVIIPADEEILALKSEFNQLKSKQKNIDAKLQIIRSEIYSAMNGNGFIPGVANVSKTEPKPGFDTKRFIEKHPDLYNRYLIQQETDISGSISFSGVPKLQKINEELYKQLKEIPDENLSASKLTQQTARTKKIEKLHENHLQELRVQRLLKWEVFLLEAKFKTIIGENSEIEGICKWNRLEKTKEKFDEKQFKEDHTELYERYILPKKPVFKLNITPNRAYPF